MVSAGPEAALAAGLTLLLAVELVLLELLLELPGELEQPASAAATAMTASGTQVCRRRPGRPVTEVVNFIFPPRGIGVGLVVRRGVGGA
jgi:hypothetical protein